MNWKVFSKISLLFITLSVGALSNAETTWIDVRSELEHLIDSIDGDVRISHDEIVSALTKIAPEKDGEIRLYCRSGGRAEKAMSALQAAGYTHVSNAGGIDDARQQRGLSE